MPIIPAETDLSGSGLPRPVTPVKENGIVASTSTQMIRVDYQKKTTILAPLQVDTNHSATVDRTPSPVSSIQEEFYSYLGISSKSSGDSDAEPTTTTPSKSPLVDEFDLSKRRSLRVRVVNKLKEHQAKMMKMAETSSTSGGSTSPDEEQQQQQTENGGLASKEATETETSLIIEEGPMGRMSRLGSTSSGSNRPNIGAGDYGSSGSNPNASSILARRCYFSKSAEHSPSESPCNVKLLPQPFVALSPLFLSPTTSATPTSQQVDNFSDFEDEIKKHVQLSSSFSSPERLSSSVATPPVTPSVDCITTDSTSTTTTPQRASSGDHQRRPGQKNTKKKQKSRKQLQISKRILIRRTADFAPPAHRKRFNSTSSKWPSSALMDPLSTPNHNNNNNRKKQKRSVEIPSCTVSLKKFQLTNKNNNKNAPPTTIQSEISPSLPEFTLIRKSEDVPPYTVLDVPAHVQKDALGPIMGTFYSERERVLLVVTEKKIVFFKHHTNVAMFQKVVQQPPHINGLSHSQPPPPKPRPVWSQIDAVDRLNRDQLVDELMFEKRIMQTKTSSAGVGGESNVNGNATTTTTTVVYVELRAQPLLKDREYRTGDMSATYVNLYYLSSDDDAAADPDDCQIIEVKSIPLDTIVALPADISYTILPIENALVMCWTERQVARRRLGICKYRLAEDLATLAGVHEFQAVDGELNGLRWNGPNYVVGTGNQQISIWDNVTGLLLSNIVLTDFELGDTIHAHVLNVDRHEKHLLLVQYWQNYLNVVHVNLLDFAYRVLKSRELNCTRQAVQSVVRVEAGDGANVIVGLVARGDRVEKRGDEGMAAAHEMLEMFDALTNRLVVMQRQDSSGGVGGGAGCSRLFLNERYLIKLGDRLEPESISIQAVNEFLFNLI